MVVSLTEIHGRAREQSFSSNLTLTHSTRLWYLTTAVGSLQIRMPDARLLRPGGAHFIVVLRSGSTAATIADNAGTPIVTTDGTSGVEALTRVSMSLLDNTTAAGEWIARKDAVSVAINPTATEFLYEHGGTVAGAGGPRVVRRYDHQLNVWSTGTNSSFNCTLGGGFRIGLLGGVWHGNSALPRNKVQAYDPPTWTTMADSPRNHQDQTTGSIGAASIEGFSMGGTFTSDPADNDGYVLGTDTWSLRTALPFDLVSNGACATDETYVYIMWGGISNVEVNRYVYRYEPSVEAYVALQPSPSLAVQDFAGAYFDGYIVKVGGRQTLSPSTEQVHLYDVALNTWVVRLGFPVAGAPQTAVGAGMSAPEGKPFLIGGTRNGVNTNTNYEYKRRTDAWIQRTSMPNIPGFLSNQVIAGTP